MTETVITIVRTFGAPRPRVWKEWTEPERFADWFGAEACVIPLSTVTMDVRPGGSWRATMLCDEGQREIHWWGEYREVVEPERLVLTFSDEPDDGPFALVTVVLTDIGEERTEMRFEQRGPLPQEALEAAKRGWSSFFDRLDERLASAA
jgi:uncharacterized protein YndB with AHSA1/START domain